MRIYGAQERCVDRQVEPSACDGKCRSLTALGRSRSDPTPSDARRSAGLIDAKMIVNGATVPFTRTSLYSRQTQRAGCARARTCDRPLSPRREGSAGSGPPSSVRREELSGSPPPRIPIAHVAPATSGDLFATVVTDMARGGWQETDPSERSGRSRANPRSMRRASRRMRCIEVSRNGGLACPGLSRPCVCRKPRFVEEESESRRPMVLRPALSHVSFDLAGAPHHPSGDAGSLASSRVSQLLALEVWE
jgi:hypothetical protein